MKVGDLVRMEASMFDHWHPYAKAIFLVSNIQEEIILDNGDCIAIDPVAQLISGHGTDSFPVEELEVIK